jgi:hypothetical protein
MMAKKICPGFEPIKKVNALKSTCTFIDKTLSAVKNDELHDSEFISAIKAQGREGLIESNPELFDCPLKADFQKRDSERVMDFIELCQTIIKIKQGDTSTFETICGNNKALAYTLSAVYRALVNKNFRAFI